VESIGKTLSSSGRICSTITRHASGTPGHSAVNREGYQDKGMREHQLPRSGAAGHEGRRRLSRNNDEAVKTRRLPCCGNGSAVDLSNIGRDDVVQSNFDVFGET
jgi:hypothetical protein